MMHIMHVTSSLKLGGAEVMLADIVAHCAARGYQQTVVYMHDGPMRERIEECGVKTIALHGFFMRHDPTVLVQLMKCIKESRPDVIHSLLWAANFWARIAGRLAHVPVINAHHTIFSGEGKESKMRSLLDYVTARFAQRFIAVSPTVEASLMHRNWIEKKRIVRIDNAINPARLVNTKPITRVAHGIAEDAYIFGAVGRLVSLKNYDLLIKAFSFLVKRHPNCMLILVGDGPEKESLAHLIDQLQLSAHIRMVGMQPAAAYYPLFNCFVHPSRVEGLSMAVLEARACGLACIVATPNNEPHPIINTKNGAVIAADNVEALCDALEQFCTQKAARNDTSYGLEFDAAMAIYEKIFMDTGQRISS